MNPSMILTFATGLLLLLTGITAGGPSSTEDTPHADETKAPAPRDA
jgi:hypothetical protein